MVVLWWWVRMRGKDKWLVVVDCMMMISASSWYLAVKQWGCDGIKWGWLQLRIWRSEPRSVGHWSRVRMVSRRRILSQSRDELNFRSGPEEEDDTWFNKEKLFKVRNLWNSFSSKNNTLFDLYFVTCLCACEMSAWYFIEQLGLHWCHYYQG